MRLKEVLPVVKCWIKYTVFRVAVGERAKVMQDTLIKIAGRRWKNVFYGGSREGVTTCRIIELELLLAALCI